MRWCRSEKPAKSAASIFPVTAGCHRTRANDNARCTFWFGVQKLLEHEPLARRPAQSTLMPDCWSTAGPTPFDSLTSVDPAASGGIDFSSK
jgi:hypothetical protein